MELIPLEVTLISATGIKDVNLLSKMDVYAVVSLSPGPTHRTPVDKVSGPNPKWNHTVRFDIPEPQAKQSHLTVRLVSDRSFGDKDIGYVTIPLKEFLDGATETPADRRMTYAVRTKSGKSKGTLDLSYKIGEKYAAPAPKAPEPAYAYPAPGTSYAAPAGQPAYPYPPPAAYPPPQQPGYAYPMPPPHHHQPGYGYPQYPPAQPGYGYPMAAPKPHKPKRGGGNMAMGLGAGLLGGLLIGDMVSDVASYDAGFDDVGGFDF